METATERTRGLPLLLWALLAGLAAGSAWLIAANQALLLFVGLAGVTAWAYTWRQPAPVMASLLLAGPLLATISFPHPAGLPDPTVYRVYGLLLVSAGLMRRSAGGHPVWSPVSVWMGGLSAVLVLTVWWRPPSFGWVPALLGIADSFLLPFVFFQLARGLCASAAVWRLFGKMALAAALLIAGLGLAEQLTGCDLLPAPTLAKELEVRQGLREEEVVRRSNGPFVAPEPYGIVLGFLFFTALPLWTQRRRRHGAGAWALAAALATILVALSCSMFRMIVLSVLVGLAVRLRLFPIAWRQYALIAAVAGLVLAASWPALQQTAFFQTRLGNVESGYARVATWKVALRMLPSYLLLGAGFQQFPEAQAAFPVRMEYKGSTPVPTAHNAFLTLLIESGLAGCLCYVGLLVSLGRAIALRCRWADSPATREYAAALGGMYCVYLIPLFTLTTHDDVAVNSIFFLLAGLLLGTPRDSREEGA